MRRRNVVLIGVGVVVLLGAGATVWALTRPPGAEQAAETYLHALEAGDAGAALALVDEDHDATAATTAFDGATALAEKGKIGATEDGASDDDTAVPITFTLDGATVEAVLHLSNSADGWRITEGALGTATVSTTLGDSVRIGGVLVPAALPVPLLPATYPVAAAPAGILSGEASITVSPGAAAEASVTATPSPQAAALAQTQVDAYLADCTQPATAVPPNCGIRVPWAADLTSLATLAFRIDTEPVLALAADGSTFAATGGVLVATATGPSRSGGTGTFTYRADDWAVRGTVTYAGDEMLLAVR